MYLPDDAALYFGRDRVVDRLVARLAERALVAVVGPPARASPPWCGQPWSLHSGLAPSPARRGTSRSPPPGADPLETVAIPPGAGRTLPADPRPFEELFTRCTRPEDRERFLDRLADVVSDTDATVRVVLMARADFYGRFAESPRFRVCGVGTHAARRPDVCGRARTSCDRCCRAPPASPSIPHSSRPS